MPKSFNRFTNYISSHVALAIDLHSASVEDLAIVFCFFDFQETKESPIKTQKLVVDLLVSGQVPQSESAKALS